MVYHDHRHSCQQGNNTYLTIPKPKLTMTTSILATVLFRHETNSANTTAPLTGKQKDNSLFQPHWIQKHIQVNCYSYVHRCGSIHVLITKCQIIYFIQVKS